MNVHERRQMRRNMSGRRRRKWLRSSNLTAFLHADRRARITIALAAKAEADPAWLMEEVFRFCDVKFYRRYDTDARRLDAARPWARWCVGGTTNIVLNCIDRHRETRGVGPDISGVGRRGQANQQRSMTYRELRSRSQPACTKACAVIGIGRGDVVAIYMPNLPETFVAFFRDPQARRNRDAAILRIRSKRRFNRV